MIRKDRQITDPDKIEEIIRSCRVMRLAMSGDNAPYVVPLNFGYQLDGSQLTLYFHCAAEGKKTDIIKKNPRVCFEMDVEFEIVGPGNEACRYSCKYASVIGFGEAREVSDHEKEKGLLLILKHAAGDRPYNLDPKAVDNTSVYKIVSSDFTGKTNK